MFHLAVPLGIGLSPIFDASNIGRSGDCHRLHIVVVVVVGSGVVDMIVLYNNELCTTKRCLWYLDRMGDH